jgi:hypothetical protein
MDTIDTIYKAISRLTSKTLRLEARCDALEIALGVVSAKAGIQADAIHKMVDEVTALSFHKRLERAEGVDPAIGAELDNRPIVADLPTDLL